MKVIKSRSHQHNIAFDLVKNVPYICDFEEVATENVSIKYMYVYICIVLLKSYIVHY